MRSVNFSAPSGPNDFQRWASEAFSEIERASRDQYLELTPNSVIITDAKQVDAVAPTANEIITLTTMSVQGSARTNSSREFLVNFGMDVAVGADGVTGDGSKDKVVLYLGMDVHAGAGDVWSFNTCMTEEPGSGVRNMQGYELDFNNNNLHFGDTFLGDGGAVHAGLSVTGAGDHRSDTAIIISGPGDYSVGAVVTVDIAMPCVVHWTGHPFVANDEVRFTTTGTLPTGMSAGINYYVIASGLTADAFEFSATLGGSAINTSGTQTGTQAATKPSQAVTIDIASPGVIHWTAHPLHADDVVAFTTTGALPTGIEANLSYYVISAGLGGDTFQISETKGGVAVNTSGSQSGIQRAIKRRPIWNRGISFTQNSINLYSYHDTSTARTSIKIDGTYKYCIDMTDSGTAYQVALRNDCFISWRNAADTADLIGFTTDLNDKLFFAVDQSVAYTNASVGVGTASPTKKFEVVGDIQIAVGGLYFADGSFQDTASSGGGGGGLQIKVEASAATTANVTLSGNQTIDGVVNPIRLLVKNQTAQEENGLYDTGAGAWVRSGDLATWADAVNAYVFILAGTTNGSTSWVSQAASTGVIGTDPMPWVQFSARTSYSAGAGLSLSGSTFSIASGGVVSSMLAGSLTLTGTTTFSSQIHLPNNVPIQMRNQANSGDVNVAYLDTSNVFQIGGGGPVQVSATTASTTSTTGALTIAGGLGVGGNTNLAGRLTIANNVGTGFLDNYSEYQIILYDGASAPASYGFGIIGNTLVFNSGAGAYSFDRGAAATTMYLSTAGNVGIGTASPAAKLEVAGNVLLPNSTAYQAKQSGGTATNILYIDGSNVTQLGGGLPAHVASTTASSSSTSGALTVAGGLGVAGAINAGGNVAIPAANAFVVGSAALSTTGGVYTYLTDPSGSIRFYLGNAGDQSNYYDNTAHRFRNTAGVTQAVIGAGSVYITGNTSPTVQFAPTSGATKNAAFIQVGDTLYTQAAGVANWMQLDLNTGALGMGIGATTGTLGGGQGIAIGNGTVGNIYTNPYVDSNYTTSGLVVKLNDQPGANTYGGTGYEYALIGTILSTHNTGNIAPNKVGVQGSAQASGGSSGNVWGGYFEAELDPGSNVNSFAIGTEIDINNYSVDKSTDYAHPAYGLQITGNSSYPSTAALLLAGTTSQWANGIVMVNMRAGVTTCGIDLAFDASNSFSHSAIHIPNNQTIAWEGAGLGPINCLYLNSSNIFQLGGGLPVTIPSYLDILSNNGTNAALFIRNDHATPGDLGFVVAAGANSDTDNLTAMVLFAYADNSLVVGGITRGFGNSVVYVTTSDERLKNVLGPTTSGLERLEKVRVRDYTFKSDPTNTVYHGYVAQELYEAYPQAVHVGGDDVEKNPWGVDHGKLTPLLVAALQEHVAATEARLAAIEARLH